MGFGAILRPVTYRFEARVPLNTFNSAEPRAKACTERWTTSRRVLSANGEESQEAPPDTRPRGASHFDQAAPVSGEVAPAASG